MESVVSLAQLQSERQQIISISDAIATDLRTLKSARELATTPQQIESISLQHRRALQSFARAQQRLRELNASIKWHNLKAQEEVRQRAKREKAARRRQTREVNDGAHPHD